MDNKTKGLIAAGAAAAVNCRPCLEILVPQCFKAGASKDEVQDAVDTGFQVNRGAHAKTRGYVNDIMTGAGEDIDGPTWEPRSEETVAQNGCC
jgi:alkylhydroperoxidase/carboxymuconolactone decarboxylase family protein YurZ